MFIKKIKSIVEENKNMKDECKKLDDKILEARKEIAWLKMLLDMKKDDDASDILSVTSRTIDDIEEILER